MVSMCIRTNGGECGDLASPEQRSLHTEHGKGLELGPGELGFLSAGAGSLALCDEEGVSLGSTGGSPSMRRGISWWRAEGASAWMPRRRLWDSSCCRSFPPSA